MSFNFTLQNKQQENYSSFLLDAVYQWNSTYAPLVYKVFFTPLQIVKIMFSSLLPIYNSLIWLAKLILNNVLLDSLLDNLPHVKDFGISTANLCKHIAVELPPYATSIAAQCNYAKDGDFCYEAGNNRVFDLITVMKDMRGMAAATSKILLSMC